MRKDQEAIELYERLMSKGPKVCDDCEEEDQLFPIVFINISTKEEQIEFLCCDCLGSTF